MSHAVLGGAITGRLLPSNLLTKSSRMWFISLKRYLEASYQAVCMVAIFAATDIMSMLDMTGTARWESGQNTCTFCGRRAHIEGFLEDHFCDGIEKERLYLS